MHICVSILTIIGSDNGLSPERRQAIIWTKAGILLIGTLGTNFSEIISKSLTFPFKKMHLKTSAKWQPFCLGPNVLNQFNVLKGGTKLPLGCILLLWLQPLSCLLMPHQQPLPHHYAYLHSYWQHNCHFLAAMITHLSQNIQHMHNRELRSITQRQVHSSTLLTTQLFLS